MTIDRAAELWYTMGKGSTKGFIDEIQTGSNLDGGNLMLLPIYTIIDMIETAENVWSDCCICAVVDKSTPATAGAGEGIQGKA